MSQEHTFFFVLVSEFSFPESDCLTSSTLVVCSTLLSVSTALFDKDSVSLTSTEASFSASFILFAGGSSIRNHLSVLICYTSIHDYPMIILLVCVAIEELMP